MNNRFLRPFDFRFKRTSLLKPSVMALFTANLYPVIGVILLDWDAFYLLIFFWIENLVIGFYTIIKMLLVPQDNARWTANLPAILFFCLHYGLFTLVHGIFIFTIFGYGLGSESPNDTVTEWQKIINHRYQLLWGTLGLLISHGISLFLNYIGSKEYKRSKIAQLMGQPYSRVVILHLTIIFSGFFVMFFGSPVIGLIFLITLKIVIDIRAHLQEHEKYSS